jgi:hypothetical protein
VNHQNTPREILDEGGKLIRVSNKPGELMRAKLIQEEQDNVSRPSGLLSVQF